MELWNFDLSDTFLYNPSLGELQFKTCDAKQEGFNLWSS